MKTNRIAVATVFCCMMVLAAASARAQITDPGGGGHDACAPAGKSDGAAPSMVVAPWRSAVFAFRNAFAPFGSTFGVWSFRDASAARPARVTARCSLRLTR